MAKSKCMEDEAADSSMRPSKQSRFEFEVFLSFRGEDTRKGFTSHLHKELVQRGIKAFIDSEKLQKGKRIIELFKYIEGSKIFVPIFSKNYADSKWCLMEIAKMVKIADTAEEKRPIIPVFFDVSPSDVKHQRGSFEAAFKKHESNKELDVDVWRNALSRAAEISAYCLHDTDETEAELTTKIGQHVSGLVSQLSYEINPIGLYFQTNKVMEMLNRETDGVCVIGIYGPGGIGKTTIAQDVYNRLSRSYDGSICFISNVRASAKKHKGLPKLQSQLINDVLRENNGIVDVEQGIGLIKRRMSSKKVLLILDDLDDKKQLDAFIGDGKSSKPEELFGAGSKIIVTTREKTVLLEHGLKEDQIYTVEELDDEHSLQLFSRHAFENDQRMTEFKDLSVKVVKVTGGLPLALIELGSLFSHIRDEKEWRATLTDLELVQHKRIHKRLKISYDSLEDGEKCIFLDIACFFIGVKKQFPVYMWEDCSRLTCGILNVLKHKSLISIDDTFRMRDQIRDMGRTIVRKEGGENPLKYSRLWDADEIKKVLEKAERSDLPHIQGMTFRNVCNRHKHLSKEASEAMSNLEMLDNINYGSEDDGPIHLPRNLKYLKLYYGGSDRVSFCEDRLKGLVVLDLSGGYFEDIGNMVLPSLKVLDVTGCKRLVRTPDFTHLLCLEKLVLDYCLSLEEIVESIGCLKKLVFLSMEGCKKLKGLPNSLCELKSLQFLVLKDCITISLLPEGLGYLKSLERLDLEGCSGLKRIPDSLGDLKNLPQLPLECCCRSLEELPIFIGKFTSLQALKLDDYCSLKRLPNSLGDLKNLSVLSLKDCTSLEQVPNSIGMLESLKTLILDGCESLTRLPDASGDLKNLKKLSLYRCISLEEVPDTIGRLESLEDLDLDNCTSIARIPDSIGDLKKLCYLSLNGCKSLEGIPDSIGRLESLEEHNLTDCTSMKGIPDFIRDLKKLRIFSLEDCHSLKRIPNSIGGLESLEELNLKGCTLMKGIPDSIGDLKKLRIFSLEDCSFLEEIPDSIGGLESLEELNLKGCTLMKGIPDSIGDLKKLRIFSLEDCSFLKKIPDSIGRLESLEKLNLTRCTSMKEELPDSIGHLKKLRIFSLEYCPSLKRIPNSIAGLESLKGLKPKDCTSMKRIHYFKRWWYNLRKNSQFH